jgi:uncharacterized membrane protein
MADTRDSQPTGLNHGPPPKRDRWVFARSQVGLALAAGVAVGGATSALMGARFGVLLGWDAACAAYVLRVWASIWGMDADRTARSAIRADPTRATTDLLILTAAVASLAAVGIVLVSAAHTKGRAQDLQIALGVVSVTVSWAVVHTVFALRYAALYYTGPDGGIDFNQPTPPDYADFAYMAFTIGMTFQVSDTQISSSAIRRTALRHALLSYLFGAGVLATTVNLVASLSSQ